MGDAERSRACSQISVNPPDPLSYSDVSRSKPLAACSTKDSRMGGLPDEPQNFSGFQDDQTLLQVAQHFAHQDRLDVAMERKKNLDVMSFLTAHGHTSEEINIFLQNCSASSNCPARQVLDERFDKQLVNTLNLSQGQLFQPVKCVGEEPIGAVGQPYQSMAAAVQPAKSPSPPRSNMAHAQSQPTQVEQGPPQTWSSLLFSNHEVQNLTLPFFPPAEPTVDPNLITILPPMDILKKGSNIWNTSLIGQFLQSKLPYKVVEPAAMRLWGKLGLQKVLLHEKGYYIFKFRELADRDNVLALGPWYISNRLILLQHWKEGFNLRQEICTKAPVWVKLHHLPFSYWTKEGLGYVASGIGKPLFTDKVTAKLDPMPFARICVEMSASSVFPDSVQVAILKEDSGSVDYVEVKLEYQNRPTSCPSCKSFGHSKLQCPKANYQWIPKSTSLSPSAPNPETSISSPSEFSHTIIPASPFSNSNTPIGNSRISMVPDTDQGLAATPVFNSFQILAHDSLEPSDPDPDISPSPTPNPLVSKLKLVDEKDDRDQKTNKLRGSQATSQNSKKKKNKGGGAG